MWSIFSEHLKLKQAMDKVLRFCRRNAIVFTCGAIFASMHYVWLQMQFDSDFVPEKQQRKEVKLGWMTFNNPHMTPKQADAENSEQPPVPKKD